MSRKQTLSGFLSMRHDKRIAHLDVLEDDSPLFEISQISGLQPRGSVPSNNIGRTDRHLRSIAFLGKGLNCLKRLHSLNERQLLLTYSSNRTRRQNLKSMREYIGGRAIRQSRDATLILQSEGRLSGLG